MSILNEIISKIKTARSIAILPHISVDGDGLGSSIALAMAVNRLDKDSAVYLEEDIPYIYEFLPTGNLVRSFQEKLQGYDLVIALDCGDMERLGKRAAIFNSAKTTVNIDHHQTNTMFAELNHVLTSASSTGEIIYELIKTAGFDVDADISTCLYTAIATDTGGFKYSNTTAETHQIAADLINNGVNVAEISKLVFDTTSLQKIKLTGMAINTLELLENGKLAIITVTDQMVREAGARDEDCDGIVNIARSVMGVEVGVLIKQKSDEEIRVNLRSNSYADVAEIARKLTGGGHKRAAGCTIRKSIEEARKILVEEIRKVL